ncbi:MAG: energy transducer TonB [Candidatus Azobacteroides sp.]|nr:energy transducer TonB [Candidatus Azobacteroides sp.]
MKKSIFFFFFNFFCLVTFPQQEESKIISGSIEEPPSFPGGSAALMKYLNDNIRYSDSMMESGIQGRVVVQFKVLGTGEIVDIKVIQSLGEEFDREAVRLIENMPLWNPGKNGGVPVNALFTVPVRFRFSY